MYQSSPISKNYNPAFFGTDVNRRNSQLIFPRRRVCLCQLCDDFIYIVHIFDVPKCGCAWTIFGRSASGRFSKKMNSENFQSSVRIIFFDFTKFWSLEEAALFSSSGSKDK